MLLDLILAATGAPIPCAPYPDIKAQLAQRYGEVTVATGLSVGGLAVEILAKPDGSTWTVLTIDPTGLACIAQAGRNLELTPPEPDGPKA